MKKPWRKGARSKKSSMIVSNHLSERGSDQFAPVSIVPELPQIMSAMDDPLDSHLLSYFITHASQALNIYSETRNPYENPVIEEAITNTGLMHSLLCLSASCLLAHQPTPAREIAVRHSHHFDRAVVTLRKGVEAYGKEASIQQGDCMMLHVSGPISPR